MGVVKNGNFISAYLGQQIDALLAAMAAANPLPSGTNWVAFIDDCEAAQENSEAYAVGTRNGDPVASTDQTYHNNSKYYAEQAGDDATTAANAATSASISSSMASSNATLAQSWAIGGTGARTGENQNNSKYWALQSQQAAQRLLIDDVTEKEYIFVMSNGRLFLEEV